MQDNANEKFALVEWNGRSTGKLNKCFLTLCVVETCVRTAICINFLFELTFACYEIMSDINFGYEMLSLRLPTKMLISIYSHYKYLQNKQLDFR